MAAAFKFCCQEAIDDRDRLVGVEPRTTEAEHVGVVVPTAHLGLVGVVGIDGADTRDLVCDDANTDTRTADEHRAFGATVGDVARGRLGEQRIIDRFVRIRPVIDNLMTAIAQRRGYGCFEFESGVV